MIDKYGTSRLRSLIVVDQPSACVVLPWMETAEAGGAGAILDFPGADQFVGAVAADNHDVRHAFLTSMLTRDIPADDLAWMAEENRQMPPVWGARLLRRALPVLRAARPVLPRCH